jgi:hypothetical protein
MTAMGTKARLFPEAPLRAVVFCFIRLSRFITFRTEERPKSNCRKEVIEE